ncbi:hypothetical protein [Devosia sp. 2618]|uniref:hypothetical protein n=1 Tax=Devosia sp. 2618 TaxID=3156454 RepID=UPI00339B7F29
MKHSDLRQRAAAMIEELIDLLDALDGDPDFEIGHDAELETDLNISPISLQSVNLVAAKRISVRRVA